MWTANQSARDFFERCSFITHGENTVDAGNGTMVETSSVVASGFVGDVGLKTPPPKYRPDDVFVFVQGRGARIHSSMQVRVRVRRGLARILGANTAVSSVGTLYDCSTAPMFNILDKVLFESLGAQLLPCSGTIPQMAAVFAFRCKCSDKHFCIACSTASDDLLSSAVSSLRRISAAKTIQLWFRRYLGRASFKKTMTENVRRKRMFSELESMTILS